MKFKLLTVFGLTIATVAGSSVLLNAMIQEREWSGERHQERERGEHRRREGRSKERGERQEGHRERERGEQSRRSEGRRSETREGGLEREGNILPINKPLSQTKYGAKLDMAFNTKTNSFDATVKNVSSKPLDRVRVEIHYIRRFEVGPSKPGPLKPGAIRKVFMKADAKKIYSWNPHAEVNVSGEKGEGHGEGGEAGHEGGRRESREKRQEGGHEAGRESRGQHEADLGGSGEGEEDGTQLAPNQTYDVTKKGVRLVMKWNAKKRAFMGVLKNVTKKTVKNVAVEVHFSTMSEIGPTKPVVLKPGQTKIYRMKNTSKGRIAGYTAHAEVGNAEHAGGGKGEGHERARGEGRRRERAGEHGRRIRESRGEHGRREVRGENGGKNS